MRNYQTRPSTGHVRNNYTKTIGRLLLGCALWCFLAVDVSAQCTCNTSQPNISIPQSGFISAQALLTSFNSATCVGPFNIVVQNQSQTQIIVSGQDSVQIPTANVGQTLVFSIDNGDDVMCDRTALVEDKLGPDIKCDTLQLFCIDPTNLSATGIPTATDNVSAPDDIVISFTDLGSTSTTCTSDGMLREIQRGFTATDQFGNTGSCVQLIEVFSIPLDSIVFPPDTILFCEGDPDMEFGRPSFRGEPLFTDFENCRLTITNTDQVISNGCNAGVYESVIRVWTVFDHCEFDGERQDTQFIQFRDTVPPEFISCAVNVEVGMTSPAACGAMIFGSIPFPIVSDVCTGIDTIIISPAFNPALPQPPGVYTVNFFARDSCGNQGTCQSTITVVDDQPPTPVCLGFVTVSVSGNQVQVPAASFDNGSFDNCDAIDLAVAFPGDPFGDFVEVGCAEAGDTLTVTLRVSEQNNPAQFSTCPAMLIVEDATAPLLFCPPDPAPVDCEELQTGVDLATLFGSPTVSDSCGFTLVENVVDNLDQCGVGSILREFTATDAAGNVAACTQTIQVVNNAPFDGGSIVFPRDTMFVNMCPADPSQFAPDSLPPGYDRPIIPDVSVCANLMTSVSDDVFNQVPGACFKIVRTFSVIDWCNFTPGDPNSTGIFTDFQEIKVLDDVPPVLNVPAAITVSLDDDCTDGPATLIATATDNCSDDITITSFSSALGTGTGDASGEYPLGSTTVVFTASDGCGNSTVGTTMVTVEDLKKPTVVCAFGLVTDLGLMNGEMMVMIDPALFDAGSFDNCPGALDFRLRRTGDGDSDVPPPPGIVTFTCDDLGQVPVEFWVIDQNGNAEFCNTFIEIQDNMNMCPDPGDPLVGSVGGSVLTPSGVQVPDVTVSLDGMSYTTDPSGDFMFENVPTGQAYTLTPARNDDPTNGATSLDLVHMTRHVLNIDPLDSPYACLAADVNGSGSITALDIVALRRVILHLDDGFPNDVPSWRFVCADYEWQNPENPFDEPFPETLFIDPLAGDLTSDFIAVKVGDVNGQ